MRYRNWKLYKEDQPANLGDGMFFAGLLASIGLIIFIILNR